MSFFTNEQRYEMLCAIKNSSNNPNIPKGPLHDAEKDFIDSYAWFKIDQLLKDPECVRLLDQHYESKWAHRFD